MQAWHNLLPGEALSRPEASTAGTPAAAVARNRRRESGVAEEDRPGLFSPPSRHFRGRRETFVQRAFRLLMTDSPVERLTFLLKSKIL